MSRTALKSILVLLCVLSFSVVNAVTIEGVEIAEKVRQPDSQSVLVLNGAGIRSKFVFSIYVGALYLPEKKTSLTDILSQDTHNRVSMHFLYDEVSQEKLANGWTEGFEENNNEAALKKLQPRLDDFNKLFKAVVKGDVIVLDYIPAKGTRVTINNEHRGTIPGHDFNQALLKVWLGEEPADSDLKTAMLGGKKEEE